MKSYKDYRFLFLAVLVFFNINIKAQTGGRITATPTLQGTNVINNKYGISGSQITATIDIDEPTLSDGQEIIETKFYRIYNDTPTQIKIQDESEVGFKTNSGLNQKLKYKVVFTIKEENGDTKEYPKDGSSIDSEEFEFSIYDDPSNFYEIDFIKQPEGSERNTYAGSKNPEIYEVTISENGDEDDNLFPSYRIDWTINEEEEPVHSGVSYEFNPSNLTNTKKVQYIFKATVNFLNPANEKEVWFAGDFKLSKTLSVYAGKPNVDITNLLHYPQNVKNNTTYNGVTCTYSVDINPDEYNDYGKILFKWYDGTTELEDIKVNSYSYKPAVTKRENHTFSVKVSCFNPDNPNEEWYIYDERSFEPLTICLNPSEIRQSIINSFITVPKVEGKERVNTYVNKEEQVYKVEIPNADEYGRWIYHWDRSFVDENNQKNTITVDSNNPDASFNPSNYGIYTTTLSIECVNPNDADENPETWLRIEDKDINIPVLSVFNNPRLLTFSDDENFIYPKGQELAEHTGTENRLKKYRVVLPSGAKLCGKWEYTWTRNNQPFTSLDSEEGSIADIPASVGVGTYNTSLELKCVNPDTGEEWRRVDVPTFSPYVLYPEPICSPNNLHINAEDNGTEYAIYVGQTFNVSELLNLIGGCDSGWNKILYVQYGEEEKKKQQDFSFAPEQTGTYILTLSVKNEAPLSDESGKKVLFGSDDNPNNNSYKDYMYTLIVNDNPYEKIGHYVDDELVNSNVNNEVNENGEIEINIVHDKNLKLIGSDSDIFNWELKDSEKNIRQTNTGNSFEWTSVNESLSEDNASEYILTCAKTNFPPHFAKGFQDIKIKIMVWKEINIRIEDLKYVDPKDELNNNDPLKGYYVLETCEGLTRTGEQIKLRSIGGASYKWNDLIWTPVSGSGPAPTSRRITLREYINTFTNTDLTPGKYYYDVTLYYDDGHATPTPYSQKVAIIVWPKPEIQSVTATLKSNVYNPNPQTSGITYDVKNYGYAFQNTAEVAGDCYLNDEILMQYELIGGISNDSQGWEYKYEDEDNQIIPENQIISHLFNSPGNNQTTKNFQIFYNYKGNYYTSNTEWFKSTDIYRFNFNVYPTPTSEPNLKDSINSVVWGENVVDVYAGGRTGDNVMMDFNHAGGYSNGWTCTWYIGKGKDGETEYEEKDQSARSWTYVPTITTEGVPYEEKRIKVHVVNSLPDGNKGIEFEKVYPIRVWRKADFKDLFTLKDEDNIVRDNKGDVITTGRIMTNGDDNQLSIREGNSISASVTTINYGYYNSNSSYLYKCNWPGAFVENNGEIEWPAFEVESTDNNNMDLETSLYKLEMVNMGPYGRPWDGKTIQYEVKVYNKPETPASIVQKGSGVSGTMIITANVTEADLKNREYYLVFGYTDANGIDHDFTSQQQKETGQVRWSSQFKNEILNEEQRKYAMEHAYAYAVWKYDNGVEITSGKCMRNGNNSIIDSNYDSSTYNGTTRAAIGDDNTDVMETIKKPTEIRNVYTINGIRVGSTISGLTPGLYIVEYADGVTNKVVLK